MRTTSSGIHIHSDDEEKCQRWGRKPFQSLPYPSPLSLSLSVSLSVRGSYSSSRSTSSRSRPAHPRYAFQNLKKKPFKLLGAKRACWPEEERTPAKHRREFFSYLVRKEAHWVECRDTSSATSIWSCSPLVFLASVCACRDPTSVTRDARARKDGLKARARVADLSLVMPEQKWPRKTSVLRGVIAARTVFNRGHSFQDLDKEAKTRLYEKAGLIHVYHPILSRSSIAKHKALSLSLSFSPRLPLSLFDSNWGNLLALSALSTTYW